MDALELIFRKELWSECKFTRLDGAGMWICRLLIHSGGGDLDCLREETGRKLEGLRPVSWGL